MRGIDLLNRWNRGIFSLLATASAVLLTAGSLPSMAANDGAVAQATGSAAPAGVSGSASASPPGAPEHWKLLEERCSKCHNSTDWAGGVAFDTLTPDTLAEDAEVWEEAIRKLRGRLMPPPGEPQPDQSTIDSFVGWME